MTLSPDDSREIGKIRERVAYLEEVTRWHLFALDLLGTMGDFYGDTRPSRNPSDIFQMACQFLKRLLNFHTLAFYTVDESDSSFTLKYCEPDGEQEPIQKAVDRQIDSGIFAWALNQNRAIVVNDGETGAKLIFHVIATKLRLRGMFVGRVSETHTHDHLDLLSMMVHSTAHMLEGISLYELINEKNHDLEELIEQRTAELKNQNALLQNEIEERIQSEKKLKERGVRLRTIINSAADGIVIIAENGAIESFNPAAERLFGYTWGEVVGKNISLIIPEPYKSSHDEYLRNYMQTGQGKIIGKGPREVPGVRRDGAIVPLEVAVSEIPLEDRRLFLGVLRDISERKRTEEELRQHREHLKELVETRTQQLTLENMERRQAEESLARALREQDTIFSANPDIIYVTDMQACLLKWNKSLETATGHSPGEIMMRNFVSLVPPNEADLVTTAFARMLSEGRCEMEIHLLTKAGALIPYNFNGVPLRNQQGQIIGFTGTGHDITERKQAEERVKKIYEQLIHSEKLSALGKLTGSIAHEFNNPIYGLRNIIEQTREEEGLDEEIRSLLDLAVRECDRMAGLVRKLQGFYKPTDDTKTSVNIHQVLDDIEILTKKKLKVKGVRLIKNYCPNLPDVNIVEDQVKQVLLNLINNAEEAITGGNGKITITTEVSGSDIKVHVQDTGEGIPEENLNLIFEPFFSTKGIKGTGLGLSICYGLVNAHGGNIEVASKPGEGSTFTLSLPIGEE